MELIKVIAKWVCKTKSLSVLAKKKSRTTTAVNPVAPVKNLESFLKFVNNDIPRNPNVSLRAHNFAKALPTPCQSKYKSIHNAGGNTILELCKQKQIIVKSRNSLT